VRRLRRHPWIVNTAIVLLGLSFVALGLALRAALPHRPARTLTVALFLLAGVALAAAGPVNLDCVVSHEPCKTAWKAGQLSWQTDGHMWLSFSGQLLLAATPFALARALWPKPRGRGVHGRRRYGTRNLASSRSRSRTVAAASLTDWPSASTSPRFTSGP